MNHPSPEMLKSFDLGRLSRNEATCIAEHLSRCTACRDTLQCAINDTRLAPAGNGAAVDPKFLELDGRGVRFGSTTLLQLADLPKELAGYAKLQFVRELGRGGMGVVYQATHLVMSRPVAVKAIRRESLMHPDALPRFLSEIKAAAQLDHPNIVRAYDSEQLGPMHLLIMEYVEGRDLQELVGTEGPMSAPLACHFARQAALGLQHAHEMGMVHRDIKPRNLIVTGDHVLKILDFGLARFLGENSEQQLTSTGNFLGTPHYVAPEQALDAHRVDIRADIYSLGATLFFMLTGHPPFQAPTAMKTILARLEGEVPELLKERPDVPSELSAVVARMMARELSDRYSSPSEVAQALDPFTKPSVRSKRKSSTTPSDAGNTSLAKSRSSRSDRVNRQSTETHQAVAFLGPNRRYRKILTATCAIVVALAAGIVIKGSQPNAQESAPQSHSKEIGAIDAFEKAVPSDPLPGQSVDSTPALAQVASDSTEIKEKGAPSDSTIPPPSQTAPPPAASSPKMAEWMRTPEFQPWVQKVSNLSGEDQAVEVTQKLRELNPRFDGRVEVLQTSPKGITRLRFLTNQVTDISPLAACRQLETLSIFGSLGPQMGQLADLSPLKGLRLSSLICANNPDLKDISILRGMPLVIFDGSHTAIQELSPLSECRDLHTLRLSDSPIDDLSGIEQLKKLDQLDLSRTRVKDINLLKGSPVQMLGLVGTNVTNLSPLKGSSVKTLGLQDTPVSDLRPLEGLPLISLNVGRTNVSDLTPIKSCPLRNLSCSESLAKKNKELLELIKSLERISHVPAQVRPE